LAGREFSVAKLNGAIGHRASYDVSEVSVDAKEIRRKKNRKQGNWESDETDGVLNESVCSNSFMYFVEIYCICHIFRNGKVMTTAKLRTKDLGQKEYYYNQQGSQIPFWLRG